MHIQTNHPIASISNIQTNSQRPSPTKRNTTHNPIQIIQPDGNTFASLLRLSLSSRRCVDRARSRARPWPVRTPLASKSAPTSVATAGPPAGAGSAGPHRRSTEATEPDPPLVRQRTSEEAPRVRQFGDVFDTNTFLRDARIHPGTVMCLTLRHETGAPGGSRRLRT